jgi:alanyl-tRNA synthetase
VFDHTVFYATSGGQQHDQGYIEFNGNKYEVKDVIKGPNGQHFHLVDLGNDKLVLNEICTLHANLDIRKRISRNHSVEHLIQHALQTVIDKSIRQEGAFKSADKVTFDFQYHHKLTDEQIIKVQAEVNKYINQALPVETHLMYLDEAKQSGAIA